MESQSFIHGGKGGYVMQATSCLQEGIDRVNRNSLWGSDESKGKMHWVGWQKVTRPKEEGGLGLH